MSCAITCPNCGNQIKPVPNEVLQYSGLTLKVDVGVVEFNGRGAQLTPCQRKILGELMRHPERVCSRDQLFTIYDQWDAEPRILDAQITYIRKAIRNSGVQIVPIRGAGYMLTAGEWPYAPRQPASKAKRDEAAALVRSGLSLAEAGRRLDLAAYTVRAAAIRAGVWPRMRL